MDVQSLDVDQQYTLKLPTQNSVFESLSFDPPRRLFGSVGGRLVCLSA